MNYIKEPINSLFFLRNLDEFYNDEANFGMLTIQSKYLIKFFKKSGIRELKKVREGVSVPQFIKKSKFL